MVREDDRAFERPRGQAWGNEAQRAVLHAIAEDVARRAGHHVAVIEALRSGDPATRDRPGTGLGLSILERVVRAHGGTSEVTSEVGAGTTFVVGLPSAAPE